MRDDKLKKKFLKIFALALFDIINFYRIEWKKIGNRKRKMELEEKENFRGPPKCLLTFQKLKLKEWIFLDKFRNESFIFI